MKYLLAFREGVKTEIEISEKNLLFIAEHASVGEVPNQMRIIGEGFKNPIGTRHLEEMLKKNQKVIVLVDDITRPTPSAKILPYILNIIEMKGIPDSAVTIMMAMGTHRPMSKHELKKKLGEQVMKRYHVINRDYRNTSQYVPIGTTRSGIPIEIAREVIQADMKIGIGNIIPHISAGWSGGAKIILPGVCSQNTTDMMHLMACIMQPVLEVIGTLDNKPKQEINEIAEKIGLDFIVNTVLDNTHRILGVFTGHFTDAHKKGVELARKQMVVPIPQQADILIVSGNPCHFDYWQGVKPYTYSHRAVRKGGVIIFLLDGSEGLCGDAPTHEETLRKYLLYSFEDLKEVAENRETDDIVGLNVPMYHSVVRHRVTTFLVTNHMSRRDIDALGFIQAPTVQDALEKSFDLLGRDAKVGIIPYGGETLVRMKDNSEPWRL